MIARVTKATRIFYTAPELEDRNDYDYELDHRDWMRCKEWLETI